VGGGGDGTPKTREGRQRLNVKYDAAHRPSHASADDTRRQIPPPPAIGAYHETASGRHDATRCIPTPLKTSNLPKRERRHSWLSQEFRHRYHTYSPTPH